MAKRTRSTTERLRDDIDSGRTGDKVRAADPAAAPLGADDEAAGTPPAASRVEAARRQELRGPASPTRRRASLSLVHLPIVVTVAVVILGSLLVVYAGR
jgi:hypothetical protein